MKIQEAAAASRLTPHTIRYYEGKGILPRPPRGPNGYRQYTEQHVATLRLAKVLRELELPLSDVAPILLIAHDGTCGEIRESMTKTFSKAFADLNARINELQQARDHVAKLVEGLRRVKPEDETLPGIAACECVRMVTA